MCGIDGLANFHQEVSLEAYYPAHLRLRHRGKDGEGFYAIHQGTGGHYQGDDSPPVFRHLPHIQGLVSASLVLGHRRLSIIDLSSGGHQPMVDPTGRYVMVYNGEIYNYIELRQELEQTGCHFTTNTDSEVLMAAFAQWGPVGFNRLNGMWALAIYDTEARQLILSRDRFGIKPLYYAWVGNTLCFGSEAKFLLPFLPHPEMNENRAIEYLTQTLLDHLPETLFKGVFQLLPGHYAVFDRNGFSQNQYWALASGQTLLRGQPMPTYEEARSQLDELLTSAVALRLRSDVPIGSLLSGGLDSTTIVCIVRRLLDQQNAGNGFDFFSAVFHEEAYSERKYIEETVAQTHMPIHWIYPDPARLEATLPDLIHHQEFPFRSLAVYSQWEIMRAVSQTPIVVLLNGQGSDEIFGGYTAHYHALIAEYLRRFQPGNAWGEARQLSRAREIALVQLIGGALRELVKASPLAHLARQRRLPYLNRPYESPAGPQPNGDIFRRALARNLTYSALPEYLRYEDRNSMAFTLESRLPFLDYRLVEWAMSLPPEYKIKGVESKRILRDYARPFIPASISARSDKMGFVSPQEKWQRESLAPILDKVFRRDLQDQFSFLNMAACREIYRQYQSGTTNVWSWVWRLAGLAWWYDHWWNA